MKKILFMLFVVVLLAAGSALAETIMVDDDATGGNSYGNTQGFAIDFDATAPLAAPTVTTGWDPPLVAGKTYPLRSISIQYGGSVTTGSAVVYLGVYNAGLGDGFVGVSTNTIDFDTVAADEWVTFEFDGINVTVDDTVGSGTGLLYFRYQSSPDAGTGFGEISTRRLNYDAAMTQGLASIIAYNTLQGARAPEYMADLTVAEGGGEVLPLNDDGTSGILAENKLDVDVWFHWYAAGDPNTLSENPLPVNPDILGHNLYLSNGGDTDPNVYLLDYVEQVHNADPYLTDPNVYYGSEEDPVTLVNGQGKKFYWQIEEVLDDGTGSPYPDGDPNNIMLDRASFTAVGADPKILSGPDHTIADENGDAQLPITTGTVANAFRWYKVVGEQDTDENGETNDTLLSDGGIYSGTDTKTLVITGGTTGNGAEAQYYCIAYNGTPGVPGTPSAVSPTAWVWIPRLMNHYTFESTSVVDGNDVTPDSISGYDMMLLSNDTGLDVPALEPNVVTGLTGSTYALKFDNPRLSDPNNVDAQYAQVNEPWAGGYKDITVSMWVYSNGSSNWNRILDYGNNNANYMFLCVNVNGDDNDTVRFAVNVNGSEQSVTTGNDALPDHEWTFVTATLKDNTARIYINGELDATNENFTNDPVSYGPTTQNWLGRSQWGGGDGYFNGMIDELKIYNYALTTEQVAQEYLDVRGDWVCNFELEDLPYDFNNDCRADLADFAIFAATWLDSNRIYPD